MSATPLVTVLMPVRNGAVHLQASLDSILSQTFTDFELLVIDDGSTDGTDRLLRAVRDPRIRVVTHAQNQGLIASLNEGLDLARGEFIARQDHDDLSHPERLLKQVNFLGAHPDCALVGCQARQIGDDNRPGLPLLRPLGAESIRWYLCFDNPFIHSAVLFRRAVIRDGFGGYPHSLHSEDYALWSRVARSHPTANLQEPLLSYREHAQSVTGSLVSAHADAFDDATERIRRENLQALFGDDPSIEADARVLSRYRRPFTPASGAVFLEVLDRRRQLFEPIAREGREFRRVLAIQYSELAYRLLPLARGRAIDLYCRVLKLHPPLAGDLPWARLAALFLLGENARGLYQRFFGRN